MKNIILTIIAALAVNFSAVAANVGVDTVSAYGGTWSNTDPANSPFSNWDLWTTDTGTNAWAGHYIAAPAAGMANLGASFTIYGNGTSGTFANAQRTFDGGPLTEGQSFQISLATAWRAGSKGIELFDSSWNKLFDFNVSSDNHYVNGTLLNSTYAQDSRWDITARQVNSTQLQVTLIRGSDISYTSGLISGSLNAFKIYAGNLGGSEPERNLYANNLAIVPEPSTGMLMGMGIAGLLIVRRIRKSA